MTDMAWIDAALTAARPQAVGALLRYFRDLDTAEEAFQDACLRALRNWPQNGPPRDPAAWLIMVGRNAALDQTRRRKKQEPLPAENPFWTAPGIVVLPHIGGPHPQRDRFVSRLFVENLKRFLDGEPLKEVVDRTAGY